MTKLYTEMLKKSRAIGERSDCTVKALAIAARISYERAHNIMKLTGRKYRKGAHMWKGVRILSNLGYSVTNIKPKQKNGCKYTPKTITQKFKKGYYICKTKDHAFAVVNGVVEDWADGRKHRIIEAWKIVKQHQK